MLIVNDHIFSFTKTHQQKYDTAHAESYLTAEEKNLIYYTNFMRQNPKIFLEKYVQTYLDSTKSKANLYINSLILELKKNKELKLLNPKYDLYKVARLHALDMGQSGKMGHNSSTGKKYFQRVDSLTNKYSFLKENCQYGYNKGIDILIDLLIDEGITDYGHRKALLDPKIEFIGVSIEKHKTYKYNCIMEFSGEIIH